MTQNQRVPHTMVDPLQLGRDALDRHAWAEAVSVFVAADRDGGLGSDDLERLGTAAWWTGQPDQATEALERAFTGYADASRSSDAARVALALAYQAFRRQASSIAMGWLARAQHLLESAPDSPSHAHIAVFHSLGALIDQPRSMDWRYVSPDYFSLFQIATRAGITFTDDHRLGRPLVAVVNEAFARAYFGRVDATGQTITFGNDGPREIIGVVDRVRRAGHAAPRAG